MPYITTGLFETQDVIYIYMYRSRTYLFLPECLKMGILHNFLRKIFVYESKVRSQSDYPSTQNTKFTPDQRITHTHTHNQPGIQLYCILSIQ